CVGSAHLDRTAPTRPGGLYDFEGGAVRKKTPKRRRIEPMSTTIGAETTDEARAGQCQVAHGVERLVASEFIRIAQPANVDDPMVVADDERVVQRRAQRIPRGPKSLHILHEAESARAGNVTAENLGVDVGSEILPPDGRAFEIDLDLEAVARIGPELRPGGTAFDTRGLRDANMAALDRQNVDARLVEGLNDGTRGAIENGNLVTLYLDDHVVDAKAENSGHQMLDGRDMRAARVTKHGAQIRGPDFGNQCAELARLSIRARSLEHDARVGLTWHEMYSDRGAAMNTKSAQRHA